MSGPLSNTIPGFLRRGFLRKFIALLLALIVYFAVLNKIGGEREIHGVSVRLSIPDTLKELEDKPQKVTIKVRASERALKQLTENDFSIDLKVDDLRFVPGSPYRLPIDARDVKAPFGVNVLSVKPALLYVDLDRVSSKNVPPKAAFDPDSKLPDGYGIGKLSFTPEALRITGPSSIVDKIEFLPTQPIPLASITQSFELSCEVAPHSSSLKVSPSKVLVLVEVVKDIDSRVFQTVPIRVLRDGSQRFSVEMLSAPNVEINVSGSRNVIEMMTKDEFKPYIDVSQFEQPGAYTVSVNCWTDREGVSVTSVYPASVKIKLSSSTK